MTPITDDTNHNFLPCIFTPCLTPVPLTQVGNVFHNTLHRTAKQLLVFVAHRHDNKQFRASWWVIMDLPQRKPSVFNVIGIARRRRVPHVCKLALGARRTHVEQFGGYSRVEDKIAMEQFDLFECLVPSRNALRCSGVVGLRRSIIGIWDVVILDGARRNE